MLCCSSENVKCLWDVTINLKKIIITRKCQGLFWLLFFMPYKVFACFPHTRLWYRLWIMQPRDKEHHRYFGKSFSNLIFWALPNSTASSYSYSLYPCHVYLCCFWFFHCHAFLSLFCLSNSQSYFSSWHLG